MQNINDDKIYLDKEGYEQYLQEIDEIREKLNNNGKVKSEAYTGAVGDGWHDNFDFEEAKREEFKILSDLRKKIEGLSRIVIIENNKATDLIDINDYVTISISFDGEDEEEMFFKLVASSSPDFNGEVSEISVNAPLGASVYQKKIGDKGSYQVGEDVANFVILDKRKTLESDEQMESKRSK